MSGWQKRGKRHPKRFLPTLLKEISTGCTRSDKDKKNPDKNNIYDIQDTKSADRQAERSGFARSKKFSASARRKTTRKAKKSARSLPETGQTGRRCTFSWYSSKYFLYSSSLLRSAWQQAPDSPAWRFLYPAHGPHRMPPRKQESQRSALLCRIFPE